MNRNGRERAQINFATTKGTELTNFLIKVAINSECSFRDSPGKNVHDLS